MLPVSPADQPNTWFGRDRDWLRDSHLAAHVESAARWRDGLIAVVDTLQTLPERCPLADEVGEHGLQWRVLLYGRKRHVYRILFTIEGDTVTIHHVRHTAQDQLSADDL